ncbi:DUF6381 family protein [Streptomyces sp. SYSU K217416]
MSDQPESRVRAEYERDKAEELLRKARNSANPEEAERLRYRAEQLKEHSEAALRHEPEQQPGDIREEYPQ